MKTILIAPDKFKGTLSANDFCLAVEKGLGQQITDFNIISIPLSDGGEGFLEVMRKTGRYLLMSSQVKDPLGRQIRTEYLSSQDGKRSVIEVAKLIGLQLFRKHEYNCLIMNTYGLGQLIQQVYKEGVEEIDIGIGGTATTDAGAGMACALGYKFLDKNNRVILPSGANLRQIHRIMPPPKAHKMRLNINGLCDVSNPMYGENGAALVFARQKGADDEGVRILDEGLQNMAFLIEKEMGIQVQDVPGSGSGGALGAGILAFLGGNLKSGAGYIMEASGFDKYIQLADLVITGEGQLDEQSRNGKLCVAVCRKSREYDKKVIAIVGSNRWNGTDCFDLICSLEEAAGNELDPFKDAALLVGKITAKMLTNGILNKIINS